MKKILTLLILMVISSCSDLEKVPEPIRSNLELRLKDPSSFEFVNSHQSKVSPFDVRRYIPILDAHVTDKAETNPNLKKELDSIFNLDRDLGYKYIIQYRAKNSFGALGLTTQYFVIDNLGEIVYSNNEDISDKEMYLKIGRKEVSRITGVSSKTN